MADRARLDCSGDYKDEYRDVLRVTALQSSEVGVYKQGRWQCQWGHTNPIIYEFIGDRNFFWLG